MGRLSRNNRKGYTMKISLGNDHAGFPMKAFVREVLDDLGVEYIDHGCHSNEPVDFPDVVQAVCASVVDGDAERGLLVCGTGIGASIAANKIPGIRAALIHDGHCAHQSVEHDDANVMCIGAQIIGPWLAKDLIRIYLDARFAAGDADFARRVKKLSDMERSTRS